MKIKNLLIIALFGLAFTSCDSFKDLTAVAVDTTLKVDVPLEATDDAVSITFKSTSAFGDFSGEAEIDLTTNKDVKDYVAGLRSIEAKSAALSFSGLSDASQVIESISIAANIVNGGSASYSGGSFTSTSGDTDISNELLPFIAGWDITKNTLVKFTVTGKANFKVTNAVKAKISIPSTVKYSPL